MMILDGIARFLAGSPKPRDLLAEQRTSAEQGQFPVICDLGIGEAFNARVAGNAVSDDIRC
jgi:carbonic anhydrase